MTIRLHTLGWQRGIGKLVQLPLSVQYLIGALPSLRRIESRHWRIALSIFAALLCSKLVIGYEWSRLQPPQVAVGLAPPGPFLTD
jgi:hypothetical protein